MIGFRKSPKLENRSSRKVSSGRMLSTNNYYRPKNQPQKPLTEQKNISKSSKKLSFSHAINYLIFVVIVGLVAFATTLSTTVDIRLKSADFSYRSATEYAQAAEEIMKKSLTNRSKLLFRSKTLEEAMTERFPEIRAIDAITPLGGRNITASIRVEEPLANVSSGGADGVIDDSGVLVSTGVTTDNGLLKVRFTSPQTNFIVGSRLITTDETRLLRLLQAELGTLSLKQTKATVISEVLFNVTDGQLEVRLVDVAFHIKLSTYADSDEQIGAIKATLRQLDREDALPTKYLDVRVPGRVFVL